MSRLVREIAIAGALLLAVASCGTGTAETTTPTLPTLKEQPTGQDADTATATTTTEAVDPEEAQLEFDECLREKGFVVPDLDSEFLDPSSNEGNEPDGAGTSEDVDLDAIEADLAECELILRDVYGEYTLSPEEKVDMMDEQLAFSQCMRDNGIDDYPDPTFDGDRLVYHLDDRGGEKESAVYEICDEELYGVGGTYEYPPDGYVDTSDDS